MQRVVCSDMLVSAFRRVAYVSVAIIYLSEEEPGLKPSGKLQGTPFPD